MIDLSAYSISSLNSTYLVGAKLGLQMVLSHFL